MCTVVSPILRTVCRPAVSASQIRSQLLHFCGGVDCSLKRGGACGLQTVRFHLEFALSDIPSECVDVH